MKNTLSSLLAKFQLLLGRSHYVVKIIIFFLLSEIPGLIILPVAELIHHTSGDNLPDKSKHLALLALVVAPLVETLIFQYLVINLLLRYIPERNPNKIAITFITSAVLFGLSHWYNVNYVVFAVAEGIVLAYAYWYFLPDKKIAFWSVVLVHFMHNGLTYLLR